MARGRHKSKSREGGQFVAIPHVVLESNAYLSLSHPARALLLEFALQYHGDDNGRLLCSGKHLARRGWKSNDVITRAKRELLNVGLIHEMVKGCRPNKASWYAVTWQELDKLAGYDFGAAKTFQRGSYRKNDALKPLPGVMATSIEPHDGIDKHPFTPADGAVKEKFRYSSAPYSGDPLEKPSIGTNKTNERQKTHPKRHGQTSSRQLDSRGLVETLAGGPQLIGHYGPFGRVLSLVS